jgi:hypothetical protein
MIGLTFLLPQTGVFGPEIGGLIFGSPVDRTMVRIDHDQAFQRTTYVRYELAKDGPCHDWLLL